MDEIIKQVTIFENCGPCLINLEYWNVRLENDLFSGLLSAINTLSAETLGSELREIVMQDFHIYLRRIDGLIIAVVAVKTSNDDAKTQSRIRSFLETIYQLLKPVDQSKTQINSKLLAKLEQKINQEVTRAFPLFQSQFAPDKRFLNDLTSIRILTQLSDQNQYTIPKIANQLHLPRSLVEEKLSALGHDGFIFIEETPAWWKERRIYSISEMGKFTLNELETQFPGLWC